ncbi:hypothetical protein Acr_12g0004330 [Actinidia rufa]|uniref:Uncharacterized protein n=1 Tax=Actinidia rufa TaxID=165716 RepID=A0A7J0FGS0_9ERIC|nr:hypothetical protein Acr_12g0004330 [Actinidia rufa]
MCRHLETAAVLWPLVNEIDGAGVICGGESTTGAMGGGREDAGRWKCQGGGGPEGGSGGRPSLERERDEGALQEQKTSEDLNPTNHEFGSSEVYCLEVSLKWYKTASFYPKTTLFH